MKTKASHTPGPWKIGTGWIYAGELGKESQTQICTYHSATTPDGEANARLIAAAPELLEALVAMLNAFDVGQRAGNTSAIAKARAAIIRAEGK